MEMLLCARYTLKFLIRTVVVLLLTRVKEHWSYYSSLTENGYRFGKIYDLSRI